MKTKMNDRWVILINKAQAYLLLEYYRRRFPETVAWVENVVKKGLNKND